MFHSMHHDPMKTSCALLSGLCLQSHMFLCSSRTRNSKLPWTCLALSQGRTCAEKCAMTSPPQQMHAQMHAWNKTALQGLVNKWAHQLFDACLVNLSISESAFAKCPKQAFGTPKQVWKPLGPSVDAVFGLASLYSYFLQNASQIVLTSSLIT